MLTAMGAVGITAILLVITKLVFIIMPVITPIGEKKGT